jgi:hypothetical protein
LLVERLPADENVVGWLALKDLDEFGLKMFRMGEARIRALDACLLIGALPIDPVTKVGVNQLLQRPATFTVRRGGGS